MQCAADPGTEVIKKTLYHHVHTAMYLTTEKNKHFPLPFRHIFPKPIWHSVGLCAFHRETL
jgi:hypothetical protein